MSTVGIIDVMNPPQPLSRRALLSAGGACFAGSLLLDSWLFDTAAADGGDTAWQQRWADATHRKFAPVSPDPDTLSQVWTTGPEDDGSLTIECIGPRTVYTRDYDRIVAYDRTDGSERWVYAANEGSFSLPSLVGSTLLVQENGTVHAVATGDGTARWVGQFAPSQQPFSTVLARGGDAYLPGQRTYLEVDPGSGFQRRSFDAQRLGTLVAAGDDALFWWANGTLRSTDATGRRRWATSLGRSNPPSGRAIAVTAETVFVRHLSPDDGPTVTALRRTDGTPLWSISDGIDGGIAVSAGPETVYVGTDFSVRGLDRVTGETRWTVSTGGMTPQPVGTPETALVPTADGIVPVDPVTGDQIGNRCLQGRSVRSLAVTPSAIYAVADDELVGLEGDR